MNRDLVSVMARMRRINDLFLDLTDERERPRNESQRQGAREDIIYHYVCSTCGARFTTPVAYHGSAGHCKDGDVVTDGRYEQLPRRKDINIEHTVPDSVVLDHFRCYCPPGHGRNAT